jgi:hypothetical protein
MPPSLPPQAFVLVTVNKWTGHTVVKRAFYCGDRLAGGKLELYMLVPGYGVVWRALHQIYGSKVEAERGLMVQVMQETSP